MYTKEYIVWDGDDDMTGTHDTENKIPERD